MIPGQPGNGCGRRTVLEQGEEGSGIIPATRSQQRGEAGVMSGGKKQKTHVEPVKGTELIGDREVAYTRFFNAKHHSYTRYGAGPSYLCQLSDGRWKIELDYRESIFEHELSRRTTRSRPRNAKEEWQTYLLEHAVEFWHAKLANYPNHQVAASLSSRRSFRRIIRNQVILALRNLSTRPLEELIKAISAVSWAKGRTCENERVMLAILAACRAHQGVPCRSEVLALLGEDVRISRIASNFNQRLSVIGFAWLPAGRPREAVVRVSEIHTR